MKKRTNHLWFEKRYYHKRQANTVSTRDDKVRFSETENTKRKIDIGSNICYNIAAYYPEYS